MEIRAATRKRARARIGLIGPSGSGKTLSALLLARGLAAGGRIILIDTERGSSEFYAGKDLVFDVLELGPPHSVARFLEALEACERAEASVIVVDSLSHAWVGDGGVLDTVDAFKDWSKATPQQRRLIDALLTSRAHVIATMRSKTQWVLENRNGKNVPLKVGVGPVQRDGIEYEFALVFELDASHAARVSKDRTNVFASHGDTVGLLTTEHGARILAWLEDGTLPVAAAIQPAQVPPALVARGKRELGDRIMALVKGDKEKARALLVSLVGVASPREVVDLDAAWEKIEAYANTQGDADAAGGSPVDDPVQQGAS